MKRNYPALFSLVIVLVLTTGLVIHYQVNNGPIDGGENITEPLSEEYNPKLGEGRSQAEGNRPPIDDELGIFNLTRSLMTGLQSIIDEEGTSVNVLDLSNEVEAQLIETIQGAEMSDEQRSMVNMLLETLSLVQELAQDGESPSTILSQVRPNNRPN